MSQLFSFSNDIVGLTWSGYVRVSLSFVGIVLNTVNIGVFMSPKLKDISYKYMLVKSAVSWAYLAFTLSTEVVSYCVNCSWSLTYAARVYSVAISIFFLSCLALFRTLIDIIISLNTYFILINKDWNRRKYTSVILLSILFIVANVYNIQKPFSFTIIKIPFQQNAFINVNNQFGQSEFNTILLIVQTVFRIFLSVVLLSIINVANLIRFRKRFKHRIIHVGVATNLTSKFFFSDSS